MIARIKIKLDQQRKKREKEEIKREKWKLRKLKEAEEREKVKSSSIYPDVVLGLGFKLIEKESPSTKKVEGLTQVKKEVNNSELKDTEVKEKFKCKEK